MTHAKTLDQLSTVHIRSYLPCHHRTCHRSTTDHKNASYPYFTRLTTNHKEKQTTYNIIPTFDERNYPGNIYYRIPWYLVWRGGGRGEGGRGGGGRGGVMPKRLKSGSGHHRLEIWGRSNGRHKIAWGRPDFFAMLGSLPSAIHDALDTLYDAVFSQFLVTWLDRSH